jgi:hypothetical protein
MLQQHSKSSIMLQQRYAKYMQSCSRVTVNHSRATQPIPSNSAIKQEAGQGKASQAIPLRETCTLFAVIALTQLLQRLLPVRAVWIWDRWFALAWLDCCRSKHMHVAPPCMSSSSRVGQQRTSYHHQQKINTIHH